MASRANVRRSRLRSGRRRSQPDAIEGIIQKLSDAQIDEIDRRILQDLLDELESA